MNIEDKFAIEELIARYNHSIDGGDYETWVNCWSEEAVMDGVGQYRVGIAAIREFANAYEENHRSKIAGLRHFTFNIISEINGAEATSQSYLQLVRTGTKGVQIIFTGRYEDVLRKSEGKWRFRGRKFIQDLPPTVE
jgi:ketosteroid isomerase-like protein